MNKEEIIARLEDLSAEQIAGFILKGTVTLEELIDGVKKGRFEWGHESQKKVKALLKKEDDNVFVAANTVAELQHYLSIFPEGSHVAEAREDIKRLEDNKNAEERKQLVREKMLEELREDINEYTPEEVRDNLNPKDLNDLCREYGIDVQKIKDYKEPDLFFDDIPQSEDDIPKGYTDVFFWGIPSSGKTCALSTIFNTIKKSYAMEAPDCDQKFGTIYRDSLINIFRNDDWGYLPGRTNRDRTQYMPFLFYQRGEDKKRKISFFELSGEVFKYFYEKAYNTKIDQDDYDRSDILKSFETLELLLKSDNQKIHYFFIDYYQETKHAETVNNFTQSNYLEAAAIYFRDKKDEKGKPIDIFKKKTDAVYVVVTKSDEIPDNDREANAIKFLNENFHTFMGVLENQCKRYSVDFKVKLFSIGNVYFKRLCKINREFSTDIIHDLMRKVQPVSDSKWRKFFNS